MVRAGSSALKDDETARDGKPRSFLYRCQARSETQATNNRRKAALAVPLLAEYPRLLSPTRRGRKGASACLPLPTYRLAIWASADANAVPRKA